MKRVLPFIIIAIFAVSTFAQTQNFDLSEYGVKIEPDKRLILVLASLEVADLETPLGEKGEVIRRELQSDLQKVNPELRQKIQLFVNQYKKRHSNASSDELIAPFISMAYSLSAVPDLVEPQRSDDLPDNLLEVLDYSVLVREFYRTPGISAKVASYYSTYQKEGEALRLSAREMVRDLTAYLRTRPERFYVERVKVDDPNLKKGEKKFRIIDRERRFQIVPELLTPKGTVNFLNIGDNYFAIVPPELDLSSSDVRRAYLQFTLDPLVLKNATDILTKSDGIKKLLEERRDAGVNISPDPFLAVSRSLVAAVDIREEEYRKTQIATQQARNKINALEKQEQKKGEKDTEKRAVVAELNNFKETLADEAALRLSESYEKGAVLAFYFANKLKGNEDSGFNIASSIKDWIVSLDPAAEDKRLEQFAEARERGTKARTLRKSQAIPFGNPLTVQLFEIDKLIADKKYSVAETDLKKLLNENPAKVRIHYALGQVYNLSASDLDETKSDEVKKLLQIAIVHYSNAIKTALPITDETPLENRIWASLSYYELGRIYEFYEQNEYAMKIYEAALKIGPVKGGAYEKALEAKENLAKLVKN